jgi:hypothetical protein
MLIAASVLLMGAGPTYRILTLYPQNPEAQAMGRLGAHLEGQSGNGVISLTLANGEVLKGRFTVNVGGKVSAFGKSRGIDRPGGAYTEAGRPILGGSPAIVDMKGPSGATAHCEVINDPAVVHGSGVCRFSNGGEFRVLY